MASASASVTPAAVPRSPWIVSPKWDAVFVVASPLVIVPAVLLLSKHVMSPERLSILVLAFATMGHHLPGYMRAYGDRDLRRRFRWRFALMPPAVFAFALLFSWPMLFGIERKPFAGFVVVILFWGVWHGTMQTYGFMRMYDMKLAPRTPRAARLDVLLCLTVFAVGVVFSDARMYSIVSGLWRSGVPPVGPEWLSALRVLVGVLVVGVGLAWLATMLREGQLRTVPGRMKLALIVSTGAIYFFSGHITTNVLVGVAAFEIFHALQYDGITWVYNRKLRERKGAAFGPLAFLFRDQWSMVFLYAVSILGFGAIYLVASDPRGYAHNDGAMLGATALYVTSALFLTSNVLHFYFDGFIWKMREDDTARNLGLEGGAQRLRVPAFSHAAKCGVLFLLLGGLFLLQLRTEPSDPAVADRNAVEASWFPRLPNVLDWRMRGELAAGHPDAALGIAREYVEMRPRSHEAWSALGLALHENGRFVEAARAFAAASDLSVRRAQYPFQEGVAWFRAGSAHYDEAEAAYREAIRRQEDVAIYHRHLGWLHLQQHRFAESAEDYQRAVELDPEHAQSRVNYARALAGSRHPDAARAQVEQARRLGLEAPPDLRFLLDG